MNKHTFLLFYKILFLLLIIKLFIRSILVDLAGKFTAKFSEEVGFELSVHVDFSFCLFVLRQRLFDAIFCVELWILALIDVVGNCNRDGDSFDFPSIFVNLLQVGDECLDLLIENGLSLWLKIRNNNADLKNHEISYWIYLYCFYIG